MAAFTPAVIVAITTTTAAATMIPPVTAAEGIVALVAEIKLQSEEKLHSYNGGMGS